MNEHEKFMKLALELACKGVGKVSPNPLVGCVIVVENKVISTGYHEKPGMPHAEAMALSQPALETEAATLYCNLEPCCHSNKRTPPCAQAIIKSGIKKVVIAQLDPNPEVSGKGVKLLKDAGIDVIVGVLEKEARELNRVFNKVMQTGLPYLHLKVAQTLDGKMASSSGESKWISDEEARAETHGLRLFYDGVMVGKQTVLKDDPELTIRMVDSKNKIPRKIIVGSLEGLTFSERVFSAQREETIILGPKPSLEEMQLLANKGVQWIALEQYDQTSFENALRELVKVGVHSCLVEGGSKLLSSLIEFNLYDRLTLYICPALLGNGISFYENPSREMSAALRTNNIKTRILGDQVVIDLEGLR
jgi:diaminohydroxyphosphoribosylaminopyrimidine deaminase / 5-amino-6-(5-phosphoribosylamino)uracil reductase